ncbi:MAG: hypothetical protein FJ398_18980 [Verrucomicrobia bacterium]|nr:hypothetical protein [Verrucomicrobiota bacterium]
MALTCPLCLARIEAKDLVHFCMLHEFKPDPRNPDSGCNLCREKEALESGTFVAHIGCKSRNPFFGRFEASEGASTEPPTEPTDNDTTAGNGPINPDGEVLGDDGLQVSHWELAMLARAATLHRDRREMWFPYPLLEAVSRAKELSEAGSRRIKLVGAREVGKTTLASLALKNDTYREDGISGFSVSSFVYATPSTGGGSPEEPFLEALHLTNVFDGTPTTTAQRLKPTLTRTKSVRAAFLAPTRRSGTAVRSAGSGWDFKRFVMSTAKPRRKPYTAAAIFYDFAGEESEAAINYLAHAQHNQFADVIAVVIDASDIASFGIPPPDKKPNSLKAALNQLQSIQPGARTRICLVVTHLDALQGRNNGTGPDVPDVLPKSPEKARKLVCGWLDACVSSSMPDRALAAEVSTRQVPTFLLWVENVGGAENTARARGLVNWLNWCFDNGLQSER